MLTRANTKIDWSDDDIDWDEVMSKTPEQEAKDEAEFDRENATWAREYAQRMSRMSSLQRYRYERHHALVSCLRARTRLANYLAMEFRLDFIIQKEAAFLKKRQLQLIDWRRFRSTGVLPTSGEN